MNSSTTKVVATVSIAHGLSHFNHLLLAPLFPFIKVQFGLSYAELGFLMTVFFVVSGVGQALSGFLVDRIGPIKVMLGSISLFVAASIVLALAPNYALLLLGSVLAGLGNAAFHPIDYSILNARIAPEKLGNAYAIHGISGNLGWAIAPLFLLTITSYSSWHVAIGAAGAMAAAIGVLVFVNRQALEPRNAIKQRAEANAKAMSSQNSNPSSLGASEGAFSFLTLPAVWMSFAFFFAYAVALGGVQSFGAEAASKQIGRASCRERV